MTRTPLWRGRRRPHARPEVGGEHDTVVVGGGLTGLTTALLLARAGHGVLLVEAGRLGSGATGRSTAKVSLLQGTRLSEMGRRQPAGTLEAYVEAGALGLAWLRRFCEDHAVPAEEATAYTYASTRAGADLVTEEAARAGRAGLPVRMDPDPPLPFATTAAVALDGQLQVDPAALVDALADEAERAGAVLVEGARVQRVRGRGPFRVSTPAGEAVAESVVLATNYPVLDRAGQFAWFTPRRSHVLALRGEAPPGMFLSAETPARSLREATVDGQRHLLVGGQGHRTGRPAGGGVDALRHWADQHFPGREEVAAWSAQDYATANGLPWLGPVLPGVPRLVAAGGYDKWGLTTAVAAATALSTRLLGGEMDGWAGALGSWRAHAPGLPAAGRNGLVAGLELGSGWVRALRPGAEEAGPRVTSRGLRPTATADGAERSAEVSAVCTHLGGVVRWNDLERSWDCPLHGSRFGTDGEVLEGPATCGLRRR